MQTNIRRSATRPQTHEGGPARNITPMAQLRRSVCSCLLWEDTFYEDGISIVDRIAGLVRECDPDEVAKLAIEARESFKLRHVPLVLVRELARHPKLPTVTTGQRDGNKVNELVSRTLARVIARADEMAEFLAIYWKDGKTAVSKQVKRGLAWSLHKFDEYQLSKYNREKAVRPRDIMFVSHPIPRDIAADAPAAAIAPAILRGSYKRGATLRHDTEQGKLWQRLAADELATADTWETRLSAGADKKQTFEELLRAGKLGYLALLRNLRNMIQASCDREVIRQAILARKGAGRVLPYRFIAAARHAPQFEPELDQAMIAAMRDLEPLNGETFVLVDNSGSMYHSMAGKSEMLRADAAAGVAIHVCGVAKQRRVFSFSDECAEVPPRNGMALRDAVQNATQHGSTMLGNAVEKLNRMQYDRLIVITDEQAHDSLPNPTGRGYVINVGAYQNGVGYGPWVHIDGFSEAILRFIAEAEKAD